MEHCVAEFILLLAGAEELGNPRLDYFHLQDLVDIGAHLWIHLQAPMHKLLHILTVVGWQRQVVSLANFLAQRHKIRCVNRWPLQTHLSQENPQRPHIRRKRVRLLLNDLRR